ncbi:MAG: hypothetical protein C0415_06080 [Thermodesulfovibrio sp.]|nr:hypothetical protein [Thermodesulfovibrio sp.]
MIKFEDVTTENFSSLSFEIKEGSVCKIITNSDNEKNRLLDTILGFHKPVSGRVLIFDNEIYSIPEKESIKIFKRIGVVLKEGSIISNLKVWENITLPVWYHTEIKPAEMEKKVISLFEEIGRDISYISGYMGKLPGPLPVHEKMLISLIRAMLMEPELMIYDSLFEGLNPEMMERLVKLTTDFHSEKKGRISVHISSDEQSLKNIKPNMVLNQSGKGFAIWQ